MRGSSAVGRVGECRRRVAIGRWRLELRAFDVDHRRSFAQEDVRDQKLSSLVRVHVPVYEPKRDVEEVPRMQVDRLFPFGPNSSRRCPEVRNP